MGVKFLSGQDMLRIVAGFDIEEEIDFIFLGVASWAALVKLEDYYDQFHPHEDLLRIRPTAIQYGMRLLMYKDPATEDDPYQKEIAAMLEKWRHKHEPFTKAMKKFLKENELSSIIDYLTTNIDRLAMLVPLI